jgi:hypothetical protein
MNRMSAHAVARKPSIGAAADKSAIDAAWLVMEAANDLGDALVVAACRRVIDASLTGAAAAADDLHIVVDYFR